MGILGVSNAKCYDTICIMSNPEGGKVGKGAGIRQSAHTDRAVDATNMMKKLSEVSWVICIDKEGSSLLVWPGSHDLFTEADDNGRSIAPVRVHLKFGQILVFRSDLVHAGDGYEAENLRLHGYMSLFTTDTTDTTDTTTTPVVEEDVVEKKSKTDKKDKKRKAEEVEEEVKPRRRSPRVREPGHIANASTKFFVLPPQYHCNIQQHMAITDDRGRFMNDEYTGRTIKDEHYVE